MANQKEKFALGAALAVGIAGYIYTQTRGTEGEETKKNGESKMTSGVENMENASIEDSKESSKDLKTGMDDTKDEGDTSSKTGAEQVNDEEKGASKDKKVEPGAKI